MKIVFTMKFILKKKIKLNWLENSSRFLHTKNSSAFSLMAKVTFTIFFNNEYLIKYIPKQTYDVNTS